MKNISFTIMKGLKTMSFLESAKARYSVRKFEDRKIEDDHMQRILEAANVAPTACNYQPQRIYVVQSEENIAKLNELCKCIFGAKTVLMFTYSTDEEWKNPLQNGIRSGIEDVSIVATHAMMEAWDLGIGSCWVNYFANAKIEEAFGLPENEKLVLLLPMGYPAADAAPIEMHSKCKAIEETVKFI